MATQWQATYPNEARPIKDCFHGNIPYYKYYRAYNPINTKVTTSGEISLLVPNPSIPVLFTP